MPRNALSVEILDEDIEFALQKNQHACAIVRAVQRTVPEAIYVTADRESVRFSLPGDFSAGPDGTRYTFPITPDVEEHVVRAFDLTGTVEPEYRVFSLKASERRPMKKVDRTAAAKRRAQGSTAQSRRTRSGTRTRSQSNRVATYNRFLDAEAAEVQS